MNIQIKTKPVASRAITVSRTFAAPRALVFSMFTDARHLAAWWGPHGFTNPVCEADPRPGGKIVIHMQAPDGTVHPMGGIFHEIVPHERIVFTSFVDLPDGKRILEGHNTVTFTESAGRTTVRVNARADGFVDFAERMLAGMEAGWSQSLDKLAAHGAHETGAKDAADQAAIRAMFGDQTNALFGKSVDLAVKHLADDVVTFALAPPLQHTGYNRAGLQSWFDTWDGPISFPMADLTIEVSGDVAFAYRLGHMTGNKKDGEKVDVWVRVTVGFRRTSGVWKVAHWHESVPFYMDGSFKAAVDLKPQGENIMKPQKIVSYEEWLKARKQHLKNEKALTRMRDLVARERRELPWVKVEKRYMFDTTEGRKTLADLFGKNSQLIIHHFMWRHDLDSGCPSCSLEADHAEGALVHLVNHDVSYVRVSRAPLEKLLAYKQRLGWKAEWVSSVNSDFNFDFHVSFTKEQLKGKVYYNYGEIDGADAFDELPGVSVFYKDEKGQVFHTYSSYARGNEEVIGVFMYLDMTPKGRNETEIMDWVKRNDEYAVQPGAACCAPAAKSA